MGDIGSITFNIGDDTYQVVNDVLLIWKGIPEHKPDFEIELEDLKRVITAAGFLKT